MSAVRNDFQTVIATLGELHAVLERLRGEFVHASGHPPTMSVRPICLTNSPTGVN